MDSHWTRGLSLPVLIVLVQTLLLEAFFTNGIWARVGTTTSSVDSPENSPGYFSIAPLATEDVRLGTLRMVREAKSTGGNREGAAQMLLSHSSEGED